MLKKIAEALADAGNIAILPHIAADGDAIGSSLALALGLSGAGKEVSVLLEEQ
ncbi:MAG: bifunctional oligoribonuclease/PAP phosphatase NrnA, partial [Clostridiaceae bacterium]|nr:bifunctional oligoribonuclease/PAP phosphatase NrnA [Clostridiaceae bacterium]